MSALTVPEPSGCGSPFVESLHSLVQRSAAIHGVSINRMLDLLTSVGSNDIDRRSFKTAGEWIGRGELTRALIFGLQELSQREGLARLSFVAVSNAVGQSRGLFSRKRRICPRCVTPDSGVNYGMLAHQLTPVTHCPLHGCQLIDRCSSCGKFLGWVNNYFLDARCYRCASDLTCIIDLPLQLDPYLAWRERQMGHLVAFLSNEFSQPISERWIGAFREAIFSLATSLDHYSPGERLHIRELVKRFRRMPDSAPSIHTLLNVCTMQAVDLSDLLRAPAESCGPRLLDIGGAKVDVVARPNHRKERWESAKAAAIELLEQGSESHLPPLGAVAARFGVTNSGIWRWFPNTAKRYRQERTARLRRNKKKRDLWSRHAAQQVLLSHLRNGTVLDIRRDGARIMVFAGVSKAQAEGALNAVRDAWMLIERINEEDLAAPSVQPEGSQFSAALGAGERRKTGGS